MIEWRRDLREFILGPAAAVDVVVTVVALVCQATLTQL